MARVTVTSPIGGWNARDSIDTMPVTDAIFLDNFYPGDADVQARNGHTSWVTGLVDNTETLMTYGGATPKMFAIAGTGIFDVTTTGAVGAAVVTGLSNARWQYSNFGASGSQYIWLCNGVDAPRHYDGSVWATPTLTGVTTTDIVNVAVHKRRLYFALNNSLSFGYLPVVSVAGTVNTFDLSSLFSLGGEITAIGSWTRDGGAGADDLFVAITSNGECAVYSGDDPASNFSLVGVFTLGRPIGRRPLVKVAADLVIITDAGFVNLSAVLPTGLSAPSAALSMKIANAVREVTVLHKDKFGWQAVLYPQGGYGLFNIPISTTGTFHQYVVNLTTGAWCRFKGQDAYCWVVHEGDIYFGGVGTVYKADTGFNDNGSAIECSGKTAFQYFGQRGLVKKFTMLRPVMGSNAALNVSIGFDVDYADGNNVFTPSAVTTQGASWNTASWNTSSWAGSKTTAQAWRTVQGIGYNSAIRIRTSTTAQSVTWYAADLIFESGKGLT